VNANDGAQAQLEGVVSGLSGNNFNPVAKAFP
jgi:hypothetical protein